MARRQSVRVVRHERTLSHQRAPAVPQPRVAQSPPWISVTICSNLHHVQPCVFAKGSPLASNRAMTCSAWSFDKKSSANSSVPPTTGFEGSEASSTQLWKTVRSPSPVLPPGPPLMTMPRAYASSTSSTSTTDIVKKPLILGVATSRIPRFRPNLLTEALAMRSACSASALICSVRRLACSFITRCCQSRGISCSDQGVSGRGCPA
mmetsp:Transcript_2272/g.8912  ORF Transcript_2272/g.8912 Transcript_2272/m.8912 type:complete len:206 (+) Transcript_2272:196-813(+)